MICTFFLEKNQTFEHFLHQKPMQRQQNTHVSANSFKETVPVTHQYLSVTVSQYLSDTSQIFSHSNISPITHRKLVQYLSSSSQITAARPSQCATSIPE
jgi:hypothetical protein